MRFPMAEQSGLLDRAWPVGSVFVSVVDTDPSALLGVGAWAAIGAGRVLVGKDAGDADFDALEETGGSKTVTLTEAQMPSHTHLQNAHSHVQNAASAATGGLVGSTPDASTNTPVTSGYSTANATATNQNAGGGGPHPNVQPYLVVRFWKRVS